MLPLIEPFCRHDNADLREAALRAVGRFGAAAWHWIMPLHEIAGGDAGDRDRFAATESLVSLVGVEPRLLPFVLAQLRSGPSVLRERIARRLGLHPELSAGAIPALFDRLEDPDEDGDVSSCAAYSLGLFGEAMRPHVERFARRIHLEDATHDAAAVLESLATLGPVAAAAIPDLKQFLDTDSDESDCRLALIALQEIPGPGRARAIVAGLFHEADVIRKIAAVCLAKLGDEVVEAIPEICRALATLAGDPTSKTSVRTDTGPVTGGDYERDLFELSWDVRADLLEVLGTLGPRAEPALPTILRFLVDDEATVRVAAVGALAAIGPRARGGLRRAATSRYADVRELAADALDE